MATACVCETYFTVSETGELCLKPGVQGLRQMIVYSTPGVHQFTKAAFPWLARVRVEVQAAGGGSAGANAAANQCIVRPGGAGGGWSESLIPAASLGASESVVVGAGGTAGIGNSAGGPGGNSSFGGFVVAIGGDGGTAGQASGTAPDAVHGVSAPLAGTGQHISGGGAGGAAIRLSATQGMSGSGGESRLGHGGFSRANEGDGTASRGRGGGAGGALSYGTAFNGGTGGDGLVIVELYG